MAFIKTGNIKNAIAKQGGFYSVKGEKLKAAKLTQAEIDEWNGVKSKVAAKVEVVVDDTLEVAATFNDIDTDGDGVISEEELVVAANNTSKKKKK